MAAVFFAVTVKRLTDLYDVLQKCSLFLSQAMYVHGEGGGVNFCLWCSISYWQILLNPNINTWLVILTSEVYCLHNYSSLPMFPLTLINNIQSLISTSCYCLATFHVLRTKYHNVCTIETTSYEWVAVEEGGRAVITLHSVEIGSSPCQDGCSSCAVKARRYHCRNVTHGRTLLLDSYTLRFIDRGGMVWKTRLRTYYTCSWRPAAVLCTIQCLLIVAAFKISPPPPTPPTTTTTTNALYTTWSIVSPDMVWWRTVLRFYGVNGGR